MDKKYIEDSKFESKNFSEEMVYTTTFENCSFANCNFANSDLTNSEFIDCTFDNCDISLAKLVNTALRDVKFNQCKMLGLHFENCNTFVFSVEFTGCRLNLSSFYTLNLKLVKFNACSLLEVDFTKCNLSGLALGNCELLGAVFDDSNLEKTDFRTATNYTIDPEKNRIRKAKFSLPHIIGLLSKYDIEIKQ
ncbi:MAG TPA: hypothetical protein DCQ31_00050 [Bacteroidales bacterium]|nr:hypothetical protein [Bacteroidales bacterium]